MSDEIEEGEESLNPAERPIFEIDSPALFLWKIMILNQPDDKGIRFLSAIVTLEFDVADALVELESGLVAAQLQDLVLSKLSQTPFTQMDEALERAVLKE